MIIEIYTLLPGQPSRRLAPVITCSPFLSFFQRYIVRVTCISLTYFWECSLAGSLKSYPQFWKAPGSFWGMDLYNALVYERKFKSEYLERQIYEGLVKSEPSIVKLIFHRKIYWEPKQTLFLFFIVFFIYV